MKHKIFTYMLLAAVMLAAGSLTSTSHATTLAGPPDEGYAQQVLPTIAVDTPAYKYLRQEYNYRGYIANPADRYNVAQLTFLSALIPGAGQMVSREWGKGALFFAGTYSLFSTSAILYNTYQSNKQVTEAMLYTSAAFAAAGLGIWIWNIIDANHTAKVKNMYLRDLLGGRCQGNANISFQPSLNVIPGNSHSHPAAGLAMRLSF